MIYYCILLLIISVITHVNALTEGRYTSFSSTNVTSYDNMEILNDEDRFKIYCLDGPSVKAKKSDR